MGEKIVLGCADIQINSEGLLQHLLALENLTQEHVIKLLDTTQQIMRLSPADLAKVLSSKIVINLFFETSTRTRNSFELAAKRLGADMVNFNFEFSATKKGETLVDTISNLNAMGADLFIIRHPSSGAVEFIARHLHHISSSACVINAGDGCHEHPSQGILDLFTIRHFKPHLDQLRIAIVGDILHSRVARSDIHALSIMGVPEIHLVGPSTLLPPVAEKLGVKLFTSLEEGIKDADVIIMLRLQRERMQSMFLPSAQEYFQLYGLTQKKLLLAKKDVIVMHPGPVNRELEIASVVADGPRSVILQQVKFATAVRMAIMSLLLNPRLFYD